VEGKQAMIQDPRDNPDQPGIGQVEPEEDKGGIPHAKVQ
jgi:hypothetical protein